jgi:hypothetical protein
LLAGLAVAAAIIVPSAFATGKTAPHSKAAPPSKTALKGTAPADNCPGAPPAAITAAIAHLEQAGTIDQAQEQAIDAQLRACGPFDLRPLVDNGTITAAQAQAVQDALAHAKVSLANAQHASTSRAGHHRHHRRHHHRS